jgi:hypothetical protein
LFADEQGTEPQFRSERLSDAKTFKFSFLPPGRYYLGFNLHDGPGIDSPYPEFYYPGVADRSKATVITLTQGQKISDLTFDRPLRLAERMLEGVAVWPEGRPYIENCSITLTTLGLVIARVIASHPMPRVVSRSKQLKDTRITWRRLFLIGKEV